MAKRKPAIREMTKDQSRELVHHMIECMHLIPDMFLENLVEHLQGEMRRRGRIKDEDDVPF